MPVVNLPPGCVGLDPQDGSPPLRARPGGSVTVSDAEAAAIDKVPGNGTAGLLSGRFRAFIGTRAGQRCPSCDRRWQAWTKVCRVCHLDTVPE
jgi:hypothetical protein